jgi:2'-hydroxyisoflavone reductase
VLAPGEPARGVQFIDARDLAAFVLLATTAGLHGPFNAIAPAGFTTMGGLLDACAAAVGQVPRVVWASATLLEREAVRPWVDLPLWLPPEGEHAAFMAVDTGRARSAGLGTRPLRETVADTLAWWRGLPEDRQRFDKAGLSPEREAAVIAAAEATVS